MSSEQITQRHLDLLLLVPMPENIALLPVNDDGFPIPHFVADESETGQERDIRVASARKMIECHKKRRCWICGKIMRKRVELRAGGFGWEWTELAWIGGPLAIKNRAYTDYAAHEECAVYAAKVCPHLNDPSHKYAGKRELPEGSRPPEGAIMRHPHVVVIAMSDTYEAVRVRQDIIFRPEKITRVRYFYKAEEITAAKSAEILTSLERKKK